MKTFNALILELQKRVNSDNPDILDHVNALLHNAVLACKTASTAVSCIGESSQKKEHINPGQNMEHQWRFVKTTKSPGRKKKGEVYR